MFPKHHGVGTVWAAPAAAAERIDLSAEPKPSSPAVSNDSEGLNAALVEALADSLETTDPTCDKPVPISMPEPSGARTPSRRHQWLSWTRWQAWWLRSFGRLA